MVGAVIEGVGEAEGLGLALEGGDAAASPVGDEEDDGGPAAHADGEDDAVARSPWPPFRLGVEAREDGVAEAGVRTVSAEA